MIIEYMNSRYGLEKVQTDKNTIILFHGRVIKFWVNDVIRLIRIRQIITIKEE